MADPKARIVLTAEDQTRAAFRSVNDNLRSMQTSVAQIRNVGGAILGNEIVQSLGTGARAIVAARVEFEKLQNTLGQAVGVGRVGDELNFIRASASRLGLEFNSTAASYAKFAAASRGTALEGAATRDIFTGIAQAATALGLSSDETAGALTAVQQIISKGKVSAEELRGQLGERLPGAFQIAARSIGVTTSELDRLLSSGSLLADDFLPKFARQLQVEFADSAERAANSTQASVNKLTTAWNDLKRTLATGPVGEAAAGGLTNLATNLQNLADRFRNADTAAEGFLDRIAQFSLPVGLTGLLFAGRGSRLAELGAAQNADSSAQDAIINRQARLPGPTASQVRRLDNAQLAGQTASANEELRKLLGSLRSPDQIQRDQIAELRRLGGLTGQDVSGGIAEINRRTGDSAAKKAATDAKSYIEALNDQIARTRELTEVERTLAEIREGKLAGASGADQVRALGRAGSLDDIKRLGDEADRALERIRRFEDADAEQGAANEKESERIRGLADQYRDLAFPLQRYYDQLAEIQTLVRSGDLDPFSGDVATSSINRKLEEAAGMHRELKRADDAAKDLGLTFESALEKAIIDFEDLRGVVQGLVKDTARIAVRKTITEPLANQLTGLFRGLFGGGGAGRLANDLGGYNALPFAEGGVMTSRGPLPLRKYAGGGIARSAQMAIFGEGDRPEAYVPLPDGRSIPVTMQGGGAPTFHNYFGSDTGRAEVANMIAVATAQLEGKILQSSSRRGAFARA